MGTAYHERAPVSDRAAGVLRALFPQVRTRGSAAVRWGTLPDMSAAPPRRRRAAFALLTTAVGLVVVEGGFRRIASTLSPAVGERIERYRQEWAPDGDALALRYRPHPYLVYTFDPATEPETNARGFTSPERPYAKPPGTLRVACFGGSTTAGPAAWPHHLERLLNEALDQPVEVLNFGVSGWTSAEGVVAYSLLARSFAPDAVVLHHVNNDIRPLELGDFRPDYAHFRRPAALDEEDGTVRIRWSWSDRLDDRLSRLSSLYVYARLWTVGPPETRYSLQNLTYRQGRPGPPEGFSAAQDTWVRNLDTIATLAEHDGAAVAVMTMPHNVVQGVGPPDWSRKLAQMNRRLLAFGADRGAILVDAAGDPAFTADLFEDPIHVTQAGEQHKASRVAEALLASGWGTASAEP